MVKYVGLGFALKMNSSAIAQIRGMSIGDASGSSVDVTTLDDLSTGDRYMRKAGGIVDPGQITLNLAYDPSDATFLALEVALGTGSTQSFQIIWPTTTIITSFVGIVQGIGGEIPFGDLVACSVSIEKTGIPGLGTT